MERSRDRHDMRTGRSPCRSTVRLVHHLGRKPIFVAHGCLAALLILGVVFKDWLRGVSCDLLPATADAGFVSGSP